MSEAGPVITTVRAAPSWSLRDLSSPRAFARGEVTPAPFVIPGEKQWRPGSQRRARTDFTLDAFGAVFTPPAPERVTHAPSFVWR